MHQFHLNPQKSALGVGELPWGAGGKVKEASLGPALLGQAPSRLKVGIGRLQVVRSSYDTTTSY